MEIASAAEARFSKHALVLLQATAAGETLGRWFRGSLIMPNLIIIY